MIKWDAYLTLKTVSEQSSAELFQVKQRRCEIHVFGAVSGSGVPGGEGKGGSSDGKLAADPFELPRSLACSSRLIELHTSVPPCFEAGCLIE
jgi:hypothetical protein